MDSKTARRFVVVLRVVAAGVAALIVTMDRPFGTSVVQASPMQSPAAEGIKVHGDWTIDVRNPDGTLVEHREFKNALESRGADFLLSLLARELTVGRWYVVLGVYGADGACSDANGNQACTLVEVQSDGSPTSGTQFKTLTVQRTPFGPLALTPFITLKGTVLATRTGKVDWVMTGLTRCPNSVAASACSTMFDINTNTVLTSTPIKNQAGGLAPIAVAFDQTVDVKVIISFS